MTLESALKSTGICPIIVRPEDVLTLSVYGEEIAQMLSRAGLTILEIADRHESTLDALKKIIPTVSAHGIMPGMGSVFSAEKAKQSIKMQAKFIVSPHFSEEIAAVCREEDIPYIPGVRTATELVHAYDQGSHIVKFFPAMDSRELKQIRQSVSYACPALSVVVSGIPVSDDGSLRAWYEAGADAIVFAGKIFPPTLMDARDWNGLAAHVKAFAAKVATLR